MDNIKRIVIYDDKGNIEHDSVPEMGFYVAINKVCGGKTIVDGRGFGHGAAFENQKDLFTMISILESKAADLKGLFTQLVLKDSLEELKKAEEESQ